MDEHIGSRKDFGVYIELQTKIRRADIARTDQFIAQIRARLEQSGRRRNPLP